MKKIILGFALVSSYTFASDNTVLDYIVEKNGNIIHKSSSFNFTRNYSVSQYDEKGFLTYSCSKYGNKTTRTIGSDILKHNDSYKLQCFANTKNNSTCTLTIYNAESNDELVKQIAESKECKSYKPKQLLKKYNFEVLLGKNDVIKLDNNYTFKYKQYILK